MAKIVATKQVQLADLVPHPENYRRGDVPRIAASLKRNGQFRAIVVRAKTNEILAGNHTYLAMRDELGWKRALVHLVETDDAEARRILLADNGTADHATNDDGMLVELLGQLEGDLTGSGWETGEVDRLLASLGPLVGDSRDTAPGDVPSEPTTRLGDVVRLGSHRILCGDCREPGVILAALDGTLVDLALTSPPYASQRKYDGTSSLVSPEDYIEWFAPFQRGLAEVLAPRGSFCLNIKAHADGGQRSLYVYDLVLRMVREWDWRLVDEFCWRDTKNGVPGSWPNRLKDAWEPVYHFSRSPKIKFNRKANATQSDAVFDYSPQTSKASTGSGLLGSEKATAERSGRAQASNVVEVASASTGQHPAVFPTELAAWFVRLLTEDGDMVLDPFVGSGSTLIAAENEGRVCCGVEISPGYCDVAIDRWERHTGLKADRGKAGMRA